MVSGSAKGWVQTGSRTESSPGLGKNKSDRKREGLLSPGTARSADLAGNVVVRIVRRSGRSRSVAISAGAVHAGILGANEPRVDRRIGIGGQRGSRQRAAVCPGAAAIPIRIAVAALGAEPDVVDRV